MEACSCILRGNCVPYDYGIVVFSHLRWDFVYQRPQHLLSRLAATRPVLFIEEPFVAESPEPFWERTTPAPNVTVCRLRTPNGTPGFDDSHVPVFNRLLPKLLAEEGFEPGAASRPALAPRRERTLPYITWIYTPMALPLARSLAPRAVVYDCMDDLASFKNAPRALLEREGQLLEWADLVFTGGPSLYRAKRDHHRMVYCFPSSVDAPHFRRALDMREASDQSTLPRPRLGFYGVIDERLDIQLLDALSTARPDWQIVMIGPVVKIKPEMLPRRQNIHYMGMRAYEQLPAYLAGWDVCLLPFACSEATRLISPTKTLEYMAAGRPIVSTPIADVAGPYGDIVYLGDTPQAFVAACERALEAGPAERAAKMRSVLAQTSWDTTVHEMGKLIQRVLEREERGENLWKRHGLL
jgi:glycosyltransferase involved in cell wall biosynthesis